MSLYVDEYFATGEVPGPGHNILTGRYACYDVYACADDRWLAVAAIEPHFFANLCRALGCEQWIDAPDRRRGAGRRCAPTSGPRSRAGRATSGSRELGPADTCVSEVASVPELVDDRALPRARTCSRTATAPEHGDFDQVGWVLAGMDRDQPGPAVRDATVTDTDALLREVGYSAARDRGTAREGSRGVTDTSTLPAERRGADRQGAVRGDRRVPGRARLHLDVVRVGRERQPVVLGRRGRRRDHRRPDRAADDALGVVPSAPLGARAHAAGAAAAGALRPEGDASGCPRRS